MKTKNLLIFGVILVGFIMLAESVSAASFIVTVDPDRVHAKDRYNVTVTVTPAMAGVLVTLDGCGVDYLNVTPASSRTNAAGKVTFTGLIAHEEGCNIEVTAAAGYSYTAGYNHISVKEESISKRHYDINVTPACVGEKIVLIVNDKILQKPVKEVTVMVYLGEARRENYISDSRGKTDEDGRFEFIPDQVGIHTMSLEKSGYYYTEAVVDVCGEAPETTTTVTATTTVPATTTVTETTIPATTTVTETTIPATTTVTETTAPTTTAPVTTTVPGGGGIGMGTIVIIIIVIVVIGGVIYYFTAMKGKGGEEGAEEAAEEGAEEAAKEEEVL